MILVQTFQKYSVPEEFGFSLWRQIERASARIFQMFENCS